MAVNRYSVVGMTCEHCVRSVSEEVGGIAGVTDVEVELSTGALTVTSSGELDEDEVRAAVREAGYHLANPAAATEATA